MPNNKLLGLIHASNHGNGKTKSYLLRELTAASLLCDVMSVLLVLVWPVSAHGIETFMTRSNKRRSLLR